MTSEVNSKSPANSLEDLAVADHEARELLQPLLGEVSLGQTFQPFTHTLEKWGLASDELFADFTALNREKILDVLSRAGSEIEGAAQKVLVKIRETTFVNGGKEVNLAAALLFERKKKGQEGRMINGSLCLLEALAGETLILRDNHIVKLDTKSRSLTGLHGLSILVPYLPLEHIPKIGKYRHLIVAGAAAVEIASFTALKALAKLKPGSDLDFYLKHSFPPFPTVDINKLLGILDFPPSDQPQPAFAPAAAPA
ncbi:MAG: hypothetical protein HYS86_03100 [Candidatus Chisholmbacteria bacterium]|nr:hypothetical protein [Candidatus Chisholmbacteria bacterium]